mmetsp:Transcript_36859/g.37309  ORF Transcript_36859/g.37309 Transcript_36859/m.37309 type:complete len:102 (-) Transcript_36859:234-539(-)
MRIVTFIYSDRELDRDREKSHSTMRKTDSEGKETDTQIHNVGGVCVMRYDRTVFFDLGGGGGWVTPVMVVMILDPPSKKRSTRKWKEEQYVLWKSYHYHSF